MNAALLNIPFPVMRAAEISGTACFASKEVKSQNQSHMYEANVIYTSQRDQAKLRVLFYILSQAK